MSLRSCINIYVNLIFIIVISFILASCSDEKPETETSKESIESAEKKANELLEKARNLMDKKRYDKAITLFEDIEKQYPFYEAAQRAKILLPRALYKEQEYERAIAEADEFIQQNPGHSELAFMHQVKAMAYYDRISDITRDQDTTSQALLVFEEIITKFPDSDYAKDAKYKIDLLRDHLAGKEMEVGRFYQKQEKYFAALNRFLQVYESYQDTAQIEEALYRIVETKKILGLSGEAREFAAILGHNYPSSKWYKKAYKLLN